jgi:hypothetical protein
MSGSSGVSWRPEVLVTLGAVFIFWDKLSKGPATKLVTRQQVKGIKQD